MRAQEFISESIIFQGYRVDFDTVNRQLIVSKNGRVVHREFSTLGSRPATDSKVKARLSAIIDQLEDEKYPDDLNMRESLDQPTPSPKAIARKFDVPVEYVKKQLERGIKVEQEHTSSLIQAREIALDHLSERPDYYEKLDTVGLEEFAPSGIYKPPVIPREPGRDPFGDDPRSQMVRKIQQLLDAGKSVFVSIPGARGRAVSTRIGDDYSYLYVRFRDFLKPKSRTRSILTVPLNTDNDEDLILSPGPRDRFIQTTGQPFDYILTARPSLEIDNSDFFLGGKQ